jgi:hypothetical protein
MDREPELQTRRLGQCGGAVTGIKLTFGRLIETIDSVHRNLAAQATKAINVGLTLRNWLIGMQIAEYELRGADRATYGDGLFSEISTQLAKKRVSNCHRRELYRYVEFYRLYPHIVGTLSPQMRALVPENSAFRAIVGTASPQLEVGSERLIHHLSYSHFELLMDLKYQVELPKKKEIEKFLQSELERVHSRKECG